MWVTSLHLPAQWSDWNLIIRRDFLLLSSTGDRTLKKHGLWRTGRTRILCHKVADISATLQTDSKVSILTARKSCSGCSGSVFLYG